MVASGESIETAAVMGGVPRCGRRAAPASPQAGPRASGYRTVTVNR